MGIPYFLRAYLHPVTITREATPRNWSHLHEQRDHGYGYKCDADIAMKLDRKALERTRYRSGYRRKSVREDGERGRDKIAEGKGKKISYKNGEVSLNREYRYLSRSTYGVRYYESMHRDRWLGKSILRHGTVNGLFRVWNIETEWMMTCDNMWNDKLDRED